MRSIFSKITRNICLVLLLVSCTDNEVRKLDEAERRKVQKEDIVKDITLTFEPKVDILFVIDNSGSMGTHQSNLSRNVSSFTNQITQNVLLDYHIGVITSDVIDRSGELIGTPPYIDKNTPDRAMRLAENMQPGWSGNWQEKFFLPLIAALKPPLVNGINKGFYREDAFLAIVFITDAAIEEPLTPRATYEELLSLKQNDKDKLAAYAAIIPPDNPNGCAEDDQWDQKNISLFLEFLNYFDNAGWGQTYFDLCSPNFGNDLARIGADLENKIEMFIPLKELPVLNTMVVKYGDQIIPEDDYIGWVYDADRIGIKLGKGLNLDEKEDAELTINYLPAKVD
ncbi:MAG: VWA domain-containing protein [Bdellovibrionales bacterium]|nr:VWA domain-containing protein [Bdellovibrionales bacterium]